MVMSVPHLAPPSNHRLPASSEAGWRRGSRMENFPENISARVLAPTGRNLLTLRTMS